MFSLGCARMTLYRYDAQYGIPAFRTDDLGFYYCCMVWYANADNDAEYAHAREGAIRITSEWLNRGVVIWDLFVRNAATGVQVEHSHPAWPHPVLSGQYSPLTNTVYVSLLHGEEQVSYKRVRSPVRFEDMTEDGKLTDSAYAYYQSVADLIGDYACFTNVHGVPITSARVRRDISHWALRHGTKRLNRRRLFE